MRPFHHNSNMGRGGDSSGPMLTEHLRDLDLELELLKRKREMIEKQQSLLNQQQAFNLQSFNFDQPQSFRDQHYDDGQFNSNRDFSSTNRDYSSSSRDFSHLYNEPQQSRDRFPRQSAKKRLGDYVWSDPPNKRSFGGPSNKFSSGPSNKFGSGPPNKFGSGPSKKFGSGPSAKQSKYVPPADRHAFVKNQPGKPKPSERFKAPPRPAKPKPTDFKPTKVVKPKTVLNKAFTDIPKQLVAGPTVPRSDAETKPILQADQPPTPQMAGRLELALGNILKVVKDTYGKNPLYKQVFAENFSNRLMKQEIRKRIRNIMIGKPVGHVPEIIQIYRKVYPNSTDKEIVEIGLTEKTGKPKFKAVTDQTHNPYIFFKRNISQLLSQSLNKIFAKVEAITREEALQKENREEENKASTSDEVTAPVEENKTESNEAYDPEIPTEEKISEETQVTEETKIIDKSNSENVCEETNDGADLKEDATGKTNEESATEKPKESKDLEGSQQNIKYPLPAVLVKYEDMMNEMMPRKLAFWLPKLKGQIMKIIEADYDFKTARKQLVKETEARLNKEQDPETSTLEANKPGTVDSKKPKLKYYVKIQGRPMLPKKPLMQPFLDQFNPKVVKRIKSLRNLLFVGFQNKADFDRIVAANGTVVGTDKIIVKISQWVTSEALNAPAESTNTPNTSTISDGDETMKDANSNDSTELNASLDNQIDELLTSIRNEEEAENGEKEAGGEENNAEETAETENDAGGEENNAEETAETENDAGGNVDETAEAENDAGGNVDETAEAENDAGGYVDETAEAENDAGGNVDENAEDDAGGEEQPNEEVNNENDENQEFTENDDQEIKEAKEKVGELKSDAKETGRATPTRSSTRLAASTPTTPSTIRTRRASRLAQN